MKLRKPEKNLNSLPSMSEEAMPFSSEAMLYASETMPY